MYPPKTDRNAALLKRHADGASAAELAREFGLTRQRVYKIIHRWAAPSEQTEPAND
jgi:Mor family transcriptional regulator